jgi:hypothetical protein
MLRHAVETPQVAAVSNRKPQIVDVSAVVVFKHSYGLREKCGVMQHSAN